MTLKVRILRCSRRLFIILVSLTMTWFSEKMLISTRCIHGFMSNLIKKSWTDSSTQTVYGILTQLFFMDVSWEPVQHVLRKLRLCSLKAFCSEIIMAKYFYDLKVFSIMNHLKKNSYWTANSFKVSKIIAILNSIE